MRGSICTKLVFMTLAMLWIIETSVATDAQELSEIVRNTVNKVAGKEIIPSDTVFELKGFHGTSTSSSVKFMDGGSAILSQYSYSTNSAIPSKPESGTLVVSLLPLLFVLSCP